MATTETTEQLDIRKKLAHIDQMLAQHDRLMLAQHDSARPEIRFEPWQIALCMGAGAAVFAAGAAFMKLMG
jgi:hypothetical protein